MILFWDPCLIEPVTYTVEYVRRVDSEWVPQLVSEGGTMLQAEIPCEPEVGEVCVGIVTAVDEAGNKDDGRPCE